MPLQSSASPTIWLDSHVQWDFLHGVRNTEKLTLKPGMCALFWTVIPVSSQRDEQPYRKQITERFNINNSALSQTRLQTGRRRTTEGRKGRLYLL